jgi:hypothetical protein
MQNMAATLWFRKVTIVRACIPLGQGMLTYRRMGRFSSRLRVMGASIPLVRHPHPREGLRKGYQPVYYAVINAAAFGVGIEEPGADDLHRHSSSQYGCAPGAAWLGRPSLPSPDLLAT